MRLTAPVIISGRRRRLRSRAPGDVLAASAPSNDYPTSARAEYVFACMKINGDTREALDQCSCSIDVIASLLPYDAYVAGETVASMNQAHGQIGTMFRGAAVARDALARLRRAQAEGRSTLFLIRVSKPIGSASSAKGSYRRPSQFRDHGPVAARIPVA